MITSKLWRRVVLLGAIASASIFPLPADNWPQWRGPFFDGSTGETNLPAQLSLRDSTVWQTPLPGRSGATPVVWEDSIFLPSPDEQKGLQLLCVDRASGHVRWRREVAVGDRVIGKNNMASCSAVTDGRLVYALFGTSNLAAFDFAGKLIWSRRLKDDYGTFANLFLYGASPLLWNGRLYVPLLQRNPPTYSHAQDLKPERPSALICLDPATGKTLWSHSRQTEAREEAMEAYTTPLPFPGAGGMEIVLVGADCVTAHAPETGEERWRYAGLNRKKNPGGRIVPSAVSAPGLVFVCGPKREQLVALRPQGEGNLGDDRVAWRTEQNIPDVPTPLVYQGKLFVLDGDRQVMNCYRPESGERIWQGRLGVREIFYTSPTGADNKIYCLSEDGSLVVLSAGDKFEVLSTTSFGEGPCLSSVVIAHGQFFIRTAKSLICLQERK